MGLQILLAAKGQASPEEMLFGLIFIGVVVVICLAYNASTQVNAPIKNGLPHCPQCGRQVTFRRDHCRACGFKFRTFGQGTPSPAPQINPLPPSTRPAPIPIPTSHWELLHKDPLNVYAKINLHQAIEENLDKRLLGPKKIEQDRIGDLVILKRSRLHYESHISLFFDNDRHGFLVEVPTHGFKIRITCPRIVPADVVGAPWDDLLENICKVDRSIIKSRKSKSQPLTYNPKHGPHPMLRVEVLSKQSSEKPPALPS